MIQFTPLLAFGGQEFIGIAIFVIVTLASIISQYLAKQKEQQAGKRQRREPLDEIQVGGQPVGQQGNKPAALEDEIGDFLRRAARGDVQRPPQQARPPQAGLPPRPAKPRPKSRRQVRPRPQAQRQPQPPVAAEIVEPLRPPVGKGLSEQVARDINTGEISRRTSQLGKETRQATSKLDKKIHESFDHQLGNLRAEAQPAEVETTLESALPITSAAGLSALLSDAESLKQAIILNEILQRPDHRW